MHNCRANKSKWKGGGGYDDTVFVRTILIVSKRHIGWKIKELLLFLVPLQSSCIGN